MNATRNRLGDETSPYLRQHADNPVHWQPWDEQALALARDTGRPILLSIGYSACHWCHVMAHESFEDPDTARLMNALFVNVKVDREERPDLDQIYQKAHMIIQQHPGGWPLTMFLTPHRQIPFFGGTYFPREARQGLPAFRDVLERVASFHAQRAGEVEEEGTAIVAALARLDETSAAGAAPASLDDSPLRLGREAVQANFDSQHGGFGRAPKFPHTPLLGFLFDEWQASRARAGGGENPALRWQLLFSLERMALGGIYDQLGGGFFRYAVDDAWEVPHFEKMLYDNGPLLGLYARVARATDDERFDLLARETGAFVIRELQSEAGGYHAALDADTDGDEGGYYLWDAQEVRSLLGDDITWRVVARSFGLDRSPNVADRWHLRLSTHPDEVAAHLELPVEDVARRLTDGRARLLAARGRRAPPARDDKILTAWNGLMIEGMAQAARFTGETAFEASATRAADFLRDTLWQSGRLYATFTEAGGPRFAAYLDDHAFLALGLLGLLQVRWREADLAFATALADAMLAGFEDAEHGGFFFTAHDHEALVHRPRPFEDDSTPSGNGAAATLLAHLGHLLGRTDYLEAAERTLRAAWGRLTNHPQACGTLLRGLRELIAPAPLVVLRGPASALTAWTDALYRGPHAAALAHCACYAIPDDAADLPPGLAQRMGPGSDAGTVAYVCHGTRCAPPVTRCEDLFDALDTTSQAQGGGIDSSNS